MQDESNQNPKLSRKQDTDNSTADGMPNGDYIKGATGSSEVINDNGSNTTGIE